MIGGLVTLLAGHLIETAKLRAYAAAFYAAAGASLLFAFVFALVALRHWIVLTYGANYPDLWIAAGFVVIAIPFIGLGVWMQQRKPKTHPAASIALLAAPVAARLAVRGAGRLSPRIIAVGVVLIAGLAVGRRLTSK
jgi:uncharacterized membrane protein YfcA